MDWIVRCAGSALVFVAGLTPSAAVAAENGPTVLIGPGEAWSYYSLPGKPAGDWKKSKLDGSWLSGAAPIGWGKTGLATEFTQAAEPSANFPVAYFRKSVSLNASPRGAFRLLIDCDDGCIAYVNGKEVARVRVPTNGPAHYGAEAHAGDLGAEVEIPAKAFRQGDNIIAVEVHQSSPRSSDMRFVAELHSAPK